MGPHTLGHRTPVTGHLVTHGPDNQGHRLCRGPPDTGPPSPSEARFLQQKPQQRSLHTGPLSACFLTSPSVSHTASGVLPGNMSPTKLKVSRFLSSSASGPPYLIKVYTVSAIGHLYFKFFLNVILHISNSHEDREREEKETIQQHMNLPFPNRPSKVLR